MTPLVETAGSTATLETADLGAALQRVLKASDEPMTVSKIKAALPTALRTLNVEETLQKQVAAGTLYQFPKYRSPHDRFWDRPMPVHIQMLIKQLVAETALAWTDLRRKLPSYAVDQAEPIFQELITRNTLHRHPRVGRGSDRYGVQKPDPKEYLRSELIASFGRLEKLGFTQAQLRAGALELLHEEEWATVPPKEPKPTAQAAPGGPVQNTATPGDPKPAPTPAAKELF